jgi:tRNA-Thr(GGU) m(6)t(6)A37 methyltransferase TsaA
MKPIGVVKTDAKKIPRHWSVSTSKGKLVIEKQYEEGLRSINKGQRIVVLFLFHQSPPFTPGNLSQKPPHLDEIKGVFNTCSPIRPNPIGMSVLDVLAVRKNVITVKGIDMLDGTPILDIKPYTVKK